MKKIDIMLVGGSFCEKVDPVRRQEQIDRRKVKMDYTAIANLSQEPVYKVFPIGSQVEHLRNYNDEV